MKRRFSEVLILSTLCSVIGALGAFDYYWIDKYWHVFPQLVEEVQRCVEMASR